jgi:hypothetical protein
VTFKDFGGSSKVIQVSILYAQWPKSQLTKKVSLILTRMFIF